MVIDCDSSSNEVKKRVFVVMLLVGKSKNVIKLKVSDLIKYIYLIDPDFNIYKNSETMDNVKRVDFPHESHSRSMA